MFINHISIHLRINIKRENAKIKIHIIIIFHTISDYYQSMQS
jgi:hypothetical protein